MKNGIKNALHTDKFVFIETFGCQMNDNDTERMYSILRGIGYRPTDSPEAARLILINTCTVRDKAEQKLYSAVGRFKSLKAQNDGLVIGVCGCVAQQAGVNLFKRAPHVDMVVGTQNVHRLPELLTQVIASGKHVLATDIDPAISETEYAARRRQVAGTKGSVSIMRGCDNHCSYCIVPQVRGPEVSRTPGDVLSEVSALVGEGAREVTLLGQNVNSYSSFNNPGNESGNNSGNEEGAGEKLNFPELLRRVCAVADLERVRFVTSHPKDISDELISLFGEEPKLARHLHLPVQSGSNMVLKRMGRGYSVERYIACVELLKSLYPDMAITTDLIVGFPGETRDDFEKSIEVVRTLEFDGIFSFKYSPRPGTPAAAFRDQLDDETKKSRLEVLLSIQKEITLKKNRALVGSTQEVLVEGSSKLDSRELTGRTTCNRVVNFPSSADTDLSKTPGVTNILIEGAYANSLRGVAVERSLLCS